ELNDKMRILRDHGMSRQKKYWHDVVGYNYRMTNLQAAIGVAQVERIDAILEKRYQIEEQYRKVLKELEFIELQRNDLPKRDKITWFVCVLLAKGYNRDRYMKQLSQKGIETRPFFYPLSQMSIYRKYVFSNRNSQEISERGINLPTFAKLKEIKKEWFEIKN
ncbi:MAG: DegT/DnrJ/EryC1/StrS family aminotransferase, partial [Candidatus Pacebacteria bacterium]|nr:DegT/DnrJ/EryC1/StrS family aminotransferase [Candidatus Paceibacterota bacterium]